MARSRNLAALSFLLLIQPAVAQLATPATELPQAPGVSDSDARQWTPGGDRLFFLTGNGSESILWTTDGTAAGTAAVLRGVEEIVAASEGQLWVRRASELWWTNGRADSEAEHKLLLPNAVQFYGRFPNDGPLLFSRSDGLNRELLRVTNDSVELLAEISPSAVVFGDDRAFLLRRDEIWTTSLGDDDARLVATAEGRVREFQSTERHAYWLAGREASETRLWRSDGANTELVASLPDRHLFADLATRGDSAFWRMVGPAANLWQFRDASSDPEQRTYFQPTVSGANQEVEGVFSLDAFARTDDGVFFMQQLGDQRRYAFLADGSSTVREIYEPCDICEDPTPVATKEHGLLFAERRIGSGHLWHTVGTSESTRPLFSCFTRCPGVFVDDFGFVTSNWDDQPPELTAVDPVTGARQVILGGTESHDSFHPSGGFLPPSTFVTEVLLGAGKQPTAIDVDTGETTSLGDFVDGRNRTPIVVPSRRDDLTYSKGRMGVGRLGVTAETSFFYPREPVDFLELGVPRVALEKVVLAADPEGVVAWRLEDPIPREVIWPEPGLETSWLPVTDDLAVFRFPDHANNTDGVVGTDGTLEGTRPLLTESAGLSLVEAHDADLVYVVKRIGSELLGVFQTDGTPEGTRSLVDLSGDPVTLPFRRDPTLTSTWMVFLLDQEGRLLRVHRETGSVQVIEVPGEELLHFFPAGERLEILVYADGRRDWYRLEDSSAIPSFIATLPEEPFESLRGGRHAVLEGVTVLFLAESVRWFTASGGYERRELSVRGSHAVSADRKSVYFGVETRDLGWEPWRIRAEDPEPRLVQDLRPGPASSEPQQWKLAGDRIFFTANDGLLGHQIWKIDPSSSECAPTNHALCLNEGRFQIDVVVSDGQGRQRRAASRPITGDTGSFWFFEPSNLELMVKVLDGRAINGRFWTFFGSLTNVEFFLTVTDAVSGLARRYGNASGNFASLGDTRSIADSPSSGATLSEVPFSLARPALVGHSEPAPCATGPEALCLQEGRFEVSVLWTDFDENNGPGRGRTLEEDTGAFWFFDEANLELMVKVLDGRAINGHFWVFYGALSNVGFELRVRDTESGAVRTYLNAPHEFASAGDIVAFPAPP